ncbi:probable pectinesterase 67 [Malania oleifera]|uniref:probable pectinesterase 67 n=1 Tax=Malania oleifera TaxID=397392 RepID=UPI0025AE8F76|nr:probable pectinesterase 67 [Malania oleifera]
MASSSSLSSAPVSNAMQVAFAFAIAVWISFPAAVHSSSTQQFSVGGSAKKVIDSPLLTEKIATNRTIKVDINGDGEFRSVQAAIDSVPEGNSEWIIVHLRKGVYREKIHVPENKPYIFMRGNGKGKTWIVWEQSSLDNKESATLRVEAPHFVAFGISFKNDAPTGVAYTSQNQSVAAFVSADKVAFYHCGFYSAHNTLFDYKGRHYYENCYIQGSVDFIFGRAQSVFHSCEIFVNADRRVQISGSITAQNRNSADEPSGFVFVKGKVYGVGEVYLGRAKGAHSRVVFAKTYISKTIVPMGWTNWSYDGSTKNMFHAEYACHGPGAASEARALWSRQLTKEEAAPFLSVDFIDGKEWLPAWL